MSERDIYLNENASAFEECRELHAAIARALAGEADAVTKAAQAFTELSRVESERDRLAEALESERRGHIACAERNVALEQAARHRNELDRALREALSMLYQTVWAEACPPGWAERVEALRLVLGDDDSDTPTDQAGS